LKSRYLKCLAINRSKSKAIITGRSVSEGFLGSPPKSQNTKSLTYVSGCKLWKGATSKLTLRVSLLENGLAHSKFGVSDFEGFSGFNDNRR